jgi:hypothetical protein
MKHLCCNKLFLLLLFLYTAAFAALNDKSAVIYYGKNISYPMVGIHDYIIVQPSNTNTATHGFEVYKDKMYAYVSIGEIDQDIAEYKELERALIIGENKAWKGKLLDLKNPAYKTFLFEKIIEPQRKRGFKNFFFDTLDSYQLTAKTKEQRAKSEAALVDIIHTFHKRYPDAKLIINRGFEILDRVHSDVNAVLFESYYHGIGGPNLDYKEVDDAARKWLNIQIQKVQSYHLPVICVDYLPLQKLASNAAPIIQKLKQKHIIPYVSTKDLDTYGLSSKNPIKREILTLIDESVHDRIFLSAHQYGAMPLEYQGYIEKLLDLHTQTLPDMKAMQQYAGVIIWLSKEYAHPQKLLDWIVNLQKYNIKVVFAGSFFIPADDSLTLLGLQVHNYEQSVTEKKSILYKDPMLGYEIQPQFSDQIDYLSLQKGQPLCTVKDANNHTSTLAAITPWGGYALGDTFMTEINEDNIWVINPFEFFKRALRLKTLIVPDTTTENAKRLLFSHIDGDGIMNRVEFNPQLFSGDIIYSEILKKYHMPISVSIVGAEVDDIGLYPNLAPQLQTIVKKIYRLSNVEAATHTFSHPFYWHQIKNGDLDEKYRLKPKGYHFSLYNEIEGMLNEINVKYLPKNKVPKAHTVFWSGDCAPTETVLANVYQHHILNINGGDTYISNLHPWLSYIAPIGLERGEYYQIYTGAQNENIYTNEWHGPFWGFKKVVQTFQLTEKPRRIKPIDIYYHYYSGSKRASLNALQYVYNWALKQDVIPVFTSEYIPKAMDYYTVSMAQENNNFLVNGMKNLKTLRLDNETEFPVIQKSKNVLGFKKISKHTYLNLGTNKQALIATASKSKQQRPYLRSANAKITANRITQNSLRLELHGHVPLKLEAYIPKNCSYALQPAAKTLEYKNNILNAVYRTKTGAVLNVVCKP